ncbi:MAG: TrkA C-terminal domain-containing protein, partial [Mailhella sp.]|nr:TrkA C-terminal domain-containing protein [Mailhella sp.]
LSYVNKIRGENYAFLRSSDAPSTGVEELRSHLAKMRFLSFTVEPGCLLDGRSLREGILRSRYRSTLIGYKRNGETMTSVDADTVLLPGDTAYLFSDNDISESDISEAFIAPAQGDVPSAAVSGDGSMAGPSAV